MTSFVERIEREGFFARPRQVAIVCTDNTDLSRGSVFSSCRASAAGSCLVPDDTTWTGDACVCATMNNYNAVFSKCIHDTPYSSCIDPNNDKTMNVWSSGHCEATTTTQPLTSNVTPTPTPISSPKVEPSSSLSAIPSTLKLTPSYALDTRSSSSELPPSLSSKGADSSSSELRSYLFSFLEQSSKNPSSEQPETGTATSSVASLSSALASELVTPVNTTTAIPVPSFVPVIIASHTTAFATSSSVTHVALPKWTGAGKLIQGYCAEQDYALLDGPIVYWAPVLGCIAGKPDCCPPNVEISTGVGNYNANFPSAVAILDRCPDDYHSVGNVCCPLDYFPWSTALGGQTPCYSKLSAAMTPPPIPATLIGRAVETTFAKPTSAIINVVYAMQYPLKPKDSGMATGTKIGIGAGTGIGVVILAVLLLLFARKHRAHKRDRVRHDGPSSSVVGGVKDAHLHTGLEVAQPAPSYRRPGLTHIPHPHTRDSMPSPLVSEADSQTAMMEKRYESGNFPYSPSSPAVGRESGNQSKVDLQDVSEYYDTARVKSGEWQRGIGNQTRY